MDFGIKQIERVWDSCLDIAAFAGVGYISGRAVNWFMNWTSAPSFFTETKQIDLRSATICCALFATIDRLVYTIFSSIAGPIEASKPVYSALRIGASMMATVSLFNVLATPIKLVSIERNPAIAIILTAIVIYSQILSHIAIFNGRYSQPQNANYDYY